MGYDKSPYNPIIHHRRSIRLQDYDYSQAGAYFLTIDTHKREYLFGEIVDGEMRLNDAGQITDKYWAEIPDRFPNAELDEFVIMPNHVHMIIVVGANPVGDHVGAIHELPLQDNAIAKRISRRKMTIPKIVGYFKMNTSKHINILRNTDGIPVWQRNYYENIIRNDYELNRIREYILNNPKNWEHDKENYFSIYEELKQYGKSKTFEINSLNIKPFNELYYYGNKDILNKHKTVFLCSRKCPSDIILKSLDWAKNKKDKGECVISGFHSRIERDVFNILLKGKQPIILVLARGMKKNWSEVIKEAIEQGRLLIVSPFDENVRHNTQENANKRNEIMTDIAEEIFLAYSSVGGKLHKLMENIKEKPIKTFE